MNSQSNSPEIRVKLSLQRQQYSDFTLDVDLNLPGKGITAIFGHSGSGKTTLLRVIAGLEKIDNTEISINGSIWQNNNRSVAPHKRRVGYVFQQSGLFSHLTAHKNMLYAVKRAQQRPDENFVREVIEVMNLTHLLNHYPDQLSGGESQRVAIARTLLSDPVLILMDEPLASLDERHKNDILPYLEKIKTTFKVPILYVSHSIKEVSRLADYAVVLDRGKAVNQGTVTEVFSTLNPLLNLGSRQSTLLEGTVVAREPQWGLVKVRFDQLELWIKDSDYKLEAQIRLQLLAKDISLTLSNNDQSSILNRVKMNISEIQTDDDDSMVLVKLVSGKDIIIARITRRSCKTLALKVGLTVWAQIKSVAIIR